MAEVCWRRISTPSGRLGFLSFVDMCLKMTCAPIVVFDELRGLVVYVACCGLGTCCIFSKVIQATKHRGMLHVTCWQLLKRPMYCLSMYKNVTQMGLYTAFLSNVLFNSHQQFWALMLLQKRCFYFYFYFWEVPFFHIFS